MKPAIHASPMMHLFVQPLSGKAFPLCVRHGCLVPVMLGLVPHRGVPKCLQFRGKYLRTALPDDAQEGECRTSHQWSLSLLCAHRYSSTAQYCLSLLMLVKRFSSRGTCS
jgi:hypothetical protein